MQHLSMHAWLVSHWVREPFQWHVCAMRPGHRFTLWSLHSMSEGIVFVRNRHDLHERLPDVWYRSVPELLGCNRMQSLRSW
jgi:hypothetical protein